MNRVNYYARYARLSRRSIRRPITYRRRTYRRTYRRSSSSSRSRSAAWAKYWLKWYYIQARRKARFQGYINSYYRSNRSRMMQNWQTMERLRNSQKIRHAERFFLARWTYLWYKRRNGYYQRMANFYLKASRNQMKQYYKYYRGQYSQYAKWLKFWAKSNAKKAAYYRATLKLWKRFNTKKTKYLLERLRRIKKEGGFRNLRAYLRLRSQYYTFINKKKSYARTLKYWKRRRDLQYKNYRKYYNSRRTLAMAYLKYYHYYRRGYNKWVSKLRNYNRTHASIKRRLLARLRKMRKNNRFLAKFEKFLVARYRFYWYRNKNRYYIHWRNKYASWANWNYNKYKLFKSMTPKRRKWYRAYYYKWYKIQRAREQKFNRLIKYNYFDNWRMNRLYLKRNMRLLGRYKFLRVVNRFLFNRQMAVHYMRWNKYYVKKRNLYRWWRIHNLRVFKRLA
eukprot:TRINITY_DN4250_c0_g1_i7.p1 TRINITY_DN4250_c0_g1~~TRINITY_DN4250_c0_g1_i7.p1  ORF type:complete len:449 (-),score=47.11 TRINITY_DN4250_c0_g1_i7:7-1353(-)